MKVGVFGASGFTGGELLRILLKHREVELTFLGAANQAGKPIISVHPHLNELSGRNFDSFNVEEALNRADFFFIALPHGKAVEVVPSLVSAGKKVVDLTADFRLSNSSNYLSWYGFEHSYPELLNQAVYGLTEIYREEIKKAQLVANPGCYATAVILGLAPLLSSKMQIKEVSVVAVSGSSGAGRGKDEKLSLSILSENLMPYKVGFTHQHLPEILEQAQKLSGQNLNLSFCPIVGPYSRGILATIFLVFSEDYNLRELEKIFFDYYQGADFVRVLKSGELPQLKSVRGTNMVEISITEGSATSYYVIVCLDNLLKGAAGQAVQNMNLMEGFPETEALQIAPLYP